MRIVTYKRIKEFTEKHPISENSLNLWYHTVLGKQWIDFNDINRTFNSVEYLGGIRSVIYIYDNFNEIKRTLNSVDYVGGNQYVFNIKGNDFRLIAIISYNAQKVYIRFIGSHSEYNRIKNIKTI